MTKAKQNIIVVTCNEVPGMRVERVIGLVRGNTVRTRHVGHDIMASLKTLVGGEPVERLLMNPEIWG